MSAIAIIPARLDSRRLPRKALAEVAGRPLIGYVIERAKQMSGLSAVVVATTSRPIDDALAEYAHSTGAAVFRGPVENVSERCLQCARAHSSQFFVRLNGDSPFPDSKLIADGLEITRSACPIDLVTNLIGRTFPYGIALEIVNVDTMASIFRTFDRDEAEHVTRRFYARPDQFVIRNIASTNPRVQRARLVVDTPDDLAMLKVIVERLGSRVLDAGYAEVAQLYLSMSPEAVSINHLKQ